MKFIFVNIIIISLFIFSFIQNKNLTEETKTPKNIDHLKEILPSLFEEYVKIFFGSQCTYSDNLTYIFLEKLNQVLK